jgi:isopentenyldiphosphate isomerase/intracellular septation protein A
LRFFPEQTSRMKIDKMILKSLLPGLLPLVVFVIADDLWGNIIGLYVAIGFGVLELIITYIRFRKIEKFILLDLGLLILLGSVSVFLKDDIYFKLKPAFIEIIFAAIIGFSLFSGRNIIFKMSLRYLKDVKVPPGAERKFNKNLKVILFITLSHTGLVIYSSYYMSKEAWAFISGILFYILIFGYFGVEFFRNKFKAQNTETDEVLPVVDEEGHVIGKASRGDCHFNRSEKLLHPVVHLHVINYKGEIFLQKRSLTKKVQPGKWDTAVGGHISFGENLELSLQREAHEEIGLVDFQPDFVMKYIWETEVEKELVFMFVCRTDVGLKINPMEISEGRFWDFKNIKKNLRQGVFTSNFEKEFLILSGEKSVLSMEITGKKMATEKRIE